MVNNRDLAPQFGDALAAAHAALPAGRGAPPAGLAGFVARAAAANAAGWREYYAASSVSLPRSPLVERFFWSSVSG